MQIELSFVSGTERVHDFMLSLSTWFYFLPEAIFTDSRLGRKQEVTDSLSRSSAGSKNWRTSFYCMKSTLEVSSRPHLVSKSESDGHSITRAGEIIMTMPHLSYLFHLTWDKLETSLYLPGDKHVKVRQRKWYRKYLRIIFRNFPYFLHRNMLWIHVRIASPRRF